MSTSDAMLHLKRRTQGAFAFSFVKPDADDNESAVYAPRDAWAPCFCPRCNVKTRPLELVIGGAS